MSRSIKRISPLLCLLAALTLQRAAPEALADDTVPATKSAVSARAASASGVLDCGMHDTQPVTAADGSVSYPDEHVFPASVALQKGDNLGFFAVQRGDNLDSQAAPVNGWVYAYRPDGRLLACTRSDASGRLILSIRGVPDTGIYQLRMVSHNNSPYEIHAARWADAQAALALGSPYRFDRFYPQQGAAFTLNVPKGGGTVTLAFNDNNKYVNAYAEITAPQGRPTMIDLGSAGHTFPAQQAGNYTIKVIPKPGTRLVGAIEAIVD